jgi:hypothetical protein
MKYGVLRSDVITRTEDPILICSVYHEPECCQISRRTGASRCLVLDVSTVAEAQVVHI